jgi:competence protein ComEC
VVISVAKLSPFGHPHPEALARLQTTNARVWRTSECGAITISTDGDDLRVETFVKCGL